MSTVSVTFESKVPSSPAELWDWSTSVRGVAEEMKPLLKLHFPKGMEHIPEDQGSMGKVLGNCRFMLFGMLPVDLSRLTFTEVEPGRRFVEQSPLLSMKSWRHERVIVPDAGGTRVVDTLEFTPRTATPVVAWFVSQLFRHRHKMLQRAFHERRSPARSAQRLQPGYM